MNNQMPYFSGQNYPNQGSYTNYPNQNEMMLERLNNRLTMLERKVRIIENRLNMQNSGPTFLKNQTDDNDDMYML